MLATHLRVTTIVYQPTVCGRIPWLQICFYRTLIPKYEQTACSRERWCIPNFRLHIQGKAKWRCTIQFRKAE